MDTPRLGMPYLASSQAQKHVTHNEALRYIDALAQISIKDRDLTAPPSIPQEGDLYFVSPIGGGDWLSMDNMLAVFQDGAWAFHTPQIGYTAWIEDEALLAIWDGSQWTDATNLPADLECQTLGINTSADPINRLAVKSDAALFDNIGAGQQIKINKSTETDTASILFQSNYSGRAEFGTTGDDDFHVKVSSDGANWNEALVINRDTGQVSFPNNREMNNFPLVNLFSDGGRMGGVPESKSVQIGPFVAPGYIWSRNDSILTGGPGFIHNNSTHGGSEDPLDPVIDALIPKIRTAGGIGLRYGPEFHTLAITAGADTKSPITYFGNTYYACIINGSNPLLPIATLGFWIRITSGEMVILSNQQNRAFRDGILQETNFSITNTDGWVHITRILDRDPSTYLGYDTNLFQIYCNFGTACLLALPYLIPGHINIDPQRLPGNIPSNSVW